MRSSRLTGVLMGRRWSVEGGTGCSKCKHNFTHNGAEKFIITMIPLDVKRVVMADMFFPHAAGEDDGVDATN